jgi:hypothetical protein
MSLLDEATRKANELIEIMKKLDTDDQRLLIIKQIKSNFCMECGQPNPYCQCWNDE